MQNLTDNEKRIIEILRILNPFESIEIKKDKEGKYDSFIVHREQKIILSKLSTAPSI